MTDIVERLRFTASCGVPDFTNSKLLEEAADEIERLREGRDTMGNLWAKEKAENERLQSKEETK